MRVIFITPSNEQFKIDYKDIAAFSKMICEKYIEESEEHKNKFEKFAENYSLFPAYYDFMIYRLRFIQLGIPFYKDCYGIPSMSSMKIKHFPRECTLDYESLQRNSDKEVDVLYPGSEKSLDHKTFIQEYEEGFLLQDGSLISIKNLVNHRKLFLVYLVQTSVLQGDICDVMEMYNREQKDILEYSYYRLGLALLGSKNPRYAIYDQYLITEMQRSILESLQLDPDIDASIQAEFHNPYRKKIFS